ncbi:MAG: sugar transferase, partial [Deltaproteobacteria bacterium]|nr:sugar transferase [Deltaproteobacteria bacterium]
EQSALVVKIHKGLDIALTVIAFVSAYFIKFYLLPKPLGGLTTGPDYYIVLLLLVIIWYLCFAYFRLYESYRKQSLPQILLQMIKAVATGMVFISVALYALKIFYVSRLLLLIFCILDVGLLAVTKSTIYLVLKRYRSRGFNFRNILIIGSKERAKELIRNINNQRHTGYRVIGCLETADADVGRHVEGGVNIIGAVNNIKEIMLGRVVDEVVFAMPLKVFDDPHPYIMAAEELGVDVTVIPDLYLNRLTYRPFRNRIQLQPYFGTFAITLASMDFHADGRMVKSLIDFAASGIGLIVVAPLFAAIALAIKISSPGPVFYKQERSGLNGRKFMFYKFRTMVANADQKRKELEALNESDGPVFKINNDPRIIPVIGPLLRKTSLDELPQLLNIFRGEMSLVGPRPPIPAEVAQYKPWQRRRLSMKPGLTCIWQTAPHRNNISFHDWMKLDLEYIDNWSMMLDFSLLLKTVKVVLLGHGR